MNYYIRSANLDDLDDINFIEANEFPVTEAAKRDDFRKRLSNEGVIFLVAQLGDKIIGIVNGCYTDKELIDDDLFCIGDERCFGNNVAIFGLAVLDEYQHNGVASKLMEEFIDKVGIGKNRIISLTCKEHLIHFYEKFGYKKVGVSKSVHGGAVWYDMQRK